MKFIDETVNTLNSPTVKDGLLVYLNLLLFEQIPILQFTAQKQGFPNLDLL